ncbi:MAG: PQQ-binding-like beta-propeller repeat protein [Bacteroidales bacterium]|nr:PQQ-binding-like beta-propeller repeat protein [Candidatus Egerieousia equi]
MRNKILLSAAFFFAFVFGANAQTEKIGDFSFAFLSDIHLSVGSNSVNDAQACIDDINNNPDIDFVLFAGDITDFGADKELVLAKNLFDKLNKPYWIIAGNHDAKWSESGCNSFLSVFGYERYTFKHKGIRFVGTNCGPQMRMAPALHSRDGLLFLDSLAKAIPADEPVFFVNHYPMDTSMLNYTAVIDRLKNMNTQLVLNGHWHQDRAMEYEGIPGVIGRSSMNAGKDGPGYNIVTVKGNNVSFRERIAPAIILRNGKKVEIEGKTKEPWYNVRLSNGLAYRTDEKYPRPNKDMNKEFPDIKELWTLEDNYDIGCGAAYSENGGKPIVVYANTKGIVKGLDAKTGKVLWEFATQGKIFSTPAIAGGTVVVGSCDTYMYALDVKSGKLKWKYKCDKSVLGAPVIFNGKVFFGASDGSFRALNLSNGSLAWRYGKIKGFIEARPYVDNYQVVIGDWANTLYSMSTATGKLQWSWSTEGSRMLSPAAVYPVKVDNRIIIVTPERYSYYIDSKTGQAIWKEYGGRESLGVSPDRSMYFVKLMKDEVWAFSTKTKFPTRVWTANLGFGYEIAPTEMTTVSGIGKSGKGLLFVPTDKGNIFAVNIADGSLRWKHKVSFALINQILPVGKDRVLVTTMDGVVAMIKY